jgi:hypothetical protein
LKENPPHDLMIDDVAPMSRFAHQIAWLGTTNPRAIASAFQFSIRTEKIMFWLIRSLTATLPAMLKPDTPR